MVPQLKTTLIRHSPMPRIGRTPTLMATLAKDTTMARLVPNTTSVLPEFPGIRPMTDLRLASAWRMGDGDNSEARSRRQADVH